MNRESGAPNQESGIGNRGSGISDSTSTALRLSLAFVRVVSVLVPSSMRVAWREEWHSEIRHRWHWMVESGALTRRSRLDLLRRSMGSVVDASWLRVLATFDLNLTQEVRYAFRSLRRAPTLTIVASSVLALGIGAGTAVFSVVDTLVLRPLPYSEPDRIVTIWQQRTDADNAIGDVAPGNFLDWREQATSFDVVAGVEPWSFDYLGTSEPRSLLAAAVTEGFFRTVGVQPLMGRTFRPEEHQEGQSNVVLLSYGCWQRYFGGDRELIGRSVILDGEPRTVVGVLPPDFQPRLLQGGREREVWAPNVIRPYEREERGSAYWNVVARLRRDVSVEQAQREMDALSTRLAAAHPQTNSGMVARLVSFRDHLIGSVRAALLVLLSAVGLILLMACANVANMLLARGAERHRELAVRSALGAGRSRLIRQLFVESLLLALLGCGAGLALAYWGTQALVALSPAGIPRMEQVGLDGRILTFSVVVAAATALLFGLTPATTCTRTDAGGLKDAGRSVGSGVSRRLRSVLVVAEVAIAMVLLVGAGLLLRSFANVLREDPGFTSSNVLAVQVFTYGPRYDTPEKQAVFYDQTLERMRTLPGVRDVGLVSAMPFFDANINIDVGFWIEGRPKPSPDAMPSTFLTMVTAEYFRVMNIPLLGGRMLTDRDRAAGPAVVLINETMASRFWSGEDPVGQRITVDWDRERREAEIVGVVGHVRHEGPESQPRPEVFFPHAQLPFGSMTFVASTLGDPASHIDAMKQQIWAVDPTLTVYDAATLDQVTSAWLAPRRFSLFLLGAFACIAFLIAAVGVYGVISFSTARRTREIGVRIAVGAQAADIRRLVLTESVVLAALGIGVGLAAAVALTRFLRALLFDVTPTDPLTLAVVSVLLLAVAVTAGYLPARRATRIDPLVALRVE
ncbi:MAG: FtsX-like permease family protein [Luteitalea sp.]|nr:FtsX-like permease family protein [Luteitalea sp.]